MTRSRRLLLAFILAPLFAPFVVTIAELLFGGYPYAPEHFGKYWESVVPVYFVTGYVLGFAIGAPVALFLMLTDRLTIANCIQWGALIAAPASIVFLIFVSGPSDFATAGIALFAHWRLSPQRSMHLPLA